MQIQVDVRRLQVGTEALSDIYRSLKRANEEIESVKRELERQSAFSHELRLLRAIDSSVEEDEHRLNHLVYGLNRICSSYQQAEKAAQEHFETDRPQYEPVNMKTLDVSELSRKTNKILYGR